MSRTILSVAFPFAPVGPRAVGGAEQILTDLDHALVAHGHSSLVVACEGSQAAGTLFPAPLPSGTLDTADRRRCTRQYQAAIDRALAYGKVDLIHMHGLDFATYRLPRDIPVLVTLHMPPPWYPEEVWSGLGENFLLQCVSESQRLSCSAGHQNLPVVRNGVALPPLTAAPSAENFALVLGRICPEKNLHSALDAGTLAGVPVLLGGQAFAYQTHLDYFQQEILPRVTQSTEPKHHFLGPLLPERKWNLLQRARCLLLPTLAPETSSLVAMEALAAGTPVIAFQSGALPEIVDDGVTGFLVSSVEEMAEAIGNLGAIDRAACRRVAEERFSLDCMVRDYLSLYERRIGSAASAALDHERQHA